MNKVYISPNLTNAPYGIKRVLEAMHQHLPSFGWQIVDNPETADVVNLHAMTQLETNKPIVYSSHGLYWGELQWPTDHLFANSVMIDTMKKADAITTPSKWVRHAITRGMLHNPRVIYHGVNPDNFQPGATQNYVLWNKARADVVSNPYEMNEVAKLLPEVGFVSTIGDKTKNVQILGVLPYETMRDVVAKAGVYLATARETFGIGTLEAMACGVPVAGWAHGGQLEIVEQGVTGYLAPYGDYNALADCIEKCLLERAELSKNCRQDVIERWQWADKIEQYANVFQLALDSHLKERPKVSIIVTAHNLGRFLPDTLDSVQNQMMQDWECLIIDDASEDDTPSISGEYTSKDTRFKYIPTPSNLKLSGARNYGFAHANGRYILPLDADDILPPNALKLLSDALDNNRDIHIAYGHLDIVNEQGEDRRRNDWPFPKFNWYHQMAHLNQLPYSAMMRREVLQNSGGYRVRDWRAEDASFWCRVTSLGFVAQKVTDETTLVYRIRSNSKGATERNEGHTDGDWTAWYPWRLGASTAQEGIKLKDKRPQAAIVPFGAQGNAPNYCWPVWSHHDSLVSVIIPCGEKHAHLLVDALDSVQSQTFPFWEAIVVNDTGKPLELNYAPWARIVDAGEHNIAIARNKGIQAARGEFVLFLDADDLLTPGAINDMVKAWLDHDGSKYIYTDWYAVRHDGRIETKAAKEYSRKTEKGMSHSITVLLPKQWALDVGLFDEHLPGWEDWEFFIKLAVNGYCGQRLQRPCFVYRMQTGDRREQSLDDKDATLPILKERYGDYFEGRLKMAACCGGNGSAIMKAKQAFGKVKTLSPSAKVQGDGMVRVEFVGNSKGSITIKNAGGVQLSRSYRMGNNNIDKYADATPEDARALVESGKCRYVRQAGIDLQQAAVTHNPPPAPIAPPPPPKRVVDPNDYNITNLKAEIIGLSVDELKEARSKEVDGKNRAMSLRYIDQLIKASERIG